MRFVTETLLSLGGGLSIPSKNIVLLTISSAAVLLALPLLGKGLQKRNHDKDSENEDNNNDSNTHSSPPELIDSCDATMPSSTISSSSSTKTLSTITTSTDTPEEWTSCVHFVAMDCEMVGAGGRNGIESILARCSIVTFVNTPTTTITTTTTTSTSTTSNNQDDKPREKDKQNEKNTCTSNTCSIQIKVLYDKFVLPTKKVTDYRTMYSGIREGDLTKENGAIPFHQCKAEVMELLTSTVDGKVVVLVGHSLQNDYEVLKLRHPSYLTRDTSLYPPFMRRGRGHKMLSRKLRDLAKEHLGIDIQTNHNSSIDASIATSSRDGAHGHSSSSKPFSLVFDEANVSNQQQRQDNTTTTDTIGHDSIEDASATLMLYWKVAHEWEERLKYPLRQIASTVKVQQQRQSSNKVFDGSSTSSSSTSGNHDDNKDGTITLYLDGCNLPMGLRRRKLRNKMNDSSTDDMNMNNDNNNNNNTSLPRQQYQLISKTSMKGNTQVMTPTDWIPRLYSILSSDNRQQQQQHQTSSSSSSSTTDNTKQMMMPQIGKVIIMMDGLSFQHRKKETRPPPKQELAPQLFLEVTEDNVQVDDVLVRRCKEDLLNDVATATTLKDSWIASVDKVIYILSKGIIKKQNDKNTKGAKNTKKDDDDDDNDNIHTTITNSSSFYAIIRRKSGGSKTHKKLFDKLRLRRPSEGCICLLPSFLSNNDRLARNSVQTAKELKRAKVSQLVEYEIRESGSVRSVVVTDDVLLSDRVVKAGGAVISYNQLQQIM